MRAHIKTCGHCGRRHTNVWLCIPVLFDVSQEIHPASAQRQADAVEALTLRRYLKVKSRNG